MTALTIYSDRDEKPLEQIDDIDTITARLADIGVEFERWEASAELAPDADADTVKQAYANQIEKLNQRYDFQTVDVVSMHPQHPDKVAMRDKFLHEHSHADFEVRFFVDGAGLFNLHTNDRVYALLCTRGDLISVPAGMLHWFDMGPEPFFKAIRFFIQPEGWVGNFTGNPIADRYPRLEAGAAG